MNETESQLQPGSSLSGERHSHLTFLPEEMSGEEEEFVLVLCSQKKPPHVEIETTNWSCWQAVVLGSKFRFVLCWCGYVIPRFGTWKDFTH